MHEKISLKFEKIEEPDMQDIGYTDTCSGSRSDCCTRVCTRNDVGASKGSLKDWDEYLEVNAGVLQY